MDREASKTPGQCDSFVSNSRRWNLWISRMKLIIFWRNSRFFFELLGGENKRTLHTWTYLPSPSLNHNTSSFKKLQHSTPCISEYPQWQSVPEDKQLASFAPPTVID